MNDVSLKGLAHAQWVIVPCLILCSLDLDSIRNSHGKSDGSQTELAASMHMGWTGVSTIRQTHTHLPKNLGAGGEFVGHLMQIPDSWTKVPGMKQNSFLVCAWRVIDYELLQKEKQL